MRNGSGGIVASSVAGGCVGDGGSSVGATSTEGGDVASGADVSAGGELQADMMTMTNIRGGSNFFIQGLLVWFFPFYLHNHMK
jgi:hypothetical protein